MRIFVTVRRMAAGLIWAMALLGAGGTVAAQTAKAGAGRALTIYNQNFAVVRETVRLNLKAGENAVTFSDITAHLEPDSVVLRDPTGKRSLQLLEQNYRADALSQGLLLSLYEGKTIDFLVNANPNGFGQTATGGNRTETARGETIRVYTGSVFDITGERKQTAYKIDNSANTVDETFEIKLRSQKKEAVSVRVVEHLYRGLNWDITAKSTPFVKNDYNTIEFRVVVVPNVEKTVTYTVHYTW